MVKAEEIIKEKINVTIRIALLYAERGESDQLFLNKVNKVIYGGDCSYTINWNELYMLVNMAYDNFIIRLQQHYWDIDERDVQLCCLLFLKLRASEIASLLDHSIHTIYKWKTLMRKKFCISDGEDIVSFLSHTILKED